MSFEPEKYISPQRASDMPVSPLENMPDFSDFRQQNDKSNQQNNEPNQQNYESTRQDAKIAQHQGIKDRWIPISVGEHSTFYTVEKANGTTSAAVDDEYYLDKWHEFREEYSEELKNLSEQNPSLYKTINSAMEDFPDDVAIIDASKGKSILKGSPELRARLFRNYDVLRTIFEDDNAPKEARKMIGGYMKTMKGKARTFMDKHYSPDIVKNANIDLLTEPRAQSEPNSQTEPDSSIELDSDAEAERRYQEAERKRVTESLDLFKDQVMRLKGHLLADSHEFDTAFKNLDDMVHGGGRIDPDLARAGLNKLLRAHDDLIDALSHFKSSNTDYLKQTLFYRKTLGEASYQREYSSAEDNKEQADSVYRKMQVREDEIQRLKNIVRTIEESLWL